MNQISGRAGGGISLEAGICGGPGILESPSSDQGPDVAPLYDVPALGMQTIFLTLHMPFIGLRLNLIII